MRYGDILKLLKILVFSLAKEATALSENCAGATT